MTYYANDHQSQYQAGASVRTRRQGCSWTSAANGADASSGGVVQRSPDAILALVTPAQETNPLTPGWSLDDIDLAMRRLGVGFEVRSGAGWAGVTAALAAGLYVVLQGDSDRFGNGTCSGAFDGDHAIGVHPARSGPELQRIDDPICPYARWERRATLRDYAEAYSRLVRFGVFTTPVPLEASMAGVKATAQGTVHAYIIRIAGPIQTIPADASPRGVIGPWVGNGLGLYDLPGLADAGDPSGRDVYLVTDDGRPVYVAAASVQANRWERTPADLGHVVTLQVDGDPVWSGELP